MKLIGNSTNQRHTVRPFAASAATTGVALLSLLITAPQAHAQGTVKTSPISIGAMRRIGYYSPQRLTIASEKPSTIKRMPEDLTAPQYGILKFGPKENPTSFVFILDEPESGAPRLFVDSNANGDLTDDPAVTWTAAPYKSQAGADLKRYMGNVSISLPGQERRFALSLYRFDKSDSDRPALKNVILYYRDYAVQGKLTLGGKEYRILLDDVMASGDFRDPKNVVMLIDVNANGRFDPRGESYPIGTPFNIAGTTYEIKNISDSGNQFEVGKSTKQVAEILPPPDLSSGKKAVPFTVKTTAGDTVRFPESFKGKIVLLDFWATWCGPCIAELPNLTAAYSKYHGQGFEVLGISLDQPNAEKKLADFTKEKNMPWAQVYDGKFWSAEIAQLYVVQAIPAAFLVDGDTGEVIASGDALRGEQLDKTIATAMARKAKGTRTVGSAIPVKPK